MKTLISFLASLLALPLLAHGSSGEQLPSRAKRIYFFEKAGLAQETAGLDELDQDLLYMRAQRQTHAELLEKYPRFSKEKLISLENLLRERP